MRRFARSAANSVSGGLSGWHEVLAPAAHALDNSTGAVPLRGIVYPRYRAGNALQFSRLSRAETALRLMGSSLNSRLLPHHGFLEATRLAREIPSYELSYGSLEQLDGHLDVLKRLLVEERSAVRA